MSGTDNEGIRLNKYIASSGLCSRREADSLIENGKVTINGIVAVQGTKVNEGDVVLVGGKNITPEDSMVYIAFNKPLGVTCTTDKRDPSNIIDYIGFDDRIFPVGRLDKNSSGLILLTNDGSIVNKLLRAENGHEKEYLVTVNHPYDKNFIKQMESGVPVLGQLTLPCKIRPAGDKTFKIILHQGLNRQIRRMCEYLGYKVTKLKRIRFMNINLGDLETGKWRYLTSSEKKELLKDI
ncbi:ribosomal large subunit pseudouridine synthase F [Ruminococcaceae bacterium R-25]|nr:ribosomal large subunit pseudouridine synthase F [Ruminococcaceae bacterium R-25]SUQ11124.1 ribosomal large subunit pseudouridine synthase F [Oscillospiraceae bacterium]